MNFPTLFRIELTAIVNHRSLFTSQLISVGSALTDEIIASKIEVLTFAVDAAWPRINKSFQLFEILAVLKTKPGINLIKPHSLAKQGQQAGLKAILPYDNSRTHLYPSLNLT